MHKLLKTLVVLVVMVSVSISGCSHSPVSGKKSYEVINNVKMVSRTEGEDILAYSGSDWDKKFWYGVNLGATTPGHYPGELSPGYEDYRRWFADMEELGIDCIRVYTILPPHFYQALVDHNRSASKSLWLVQGIWSPEEELINEKNAYLPAITDKFKQEISYAVDAVYGKGEIPPCPGKASGDYTVNAAPYLLAWMVGSEWSPYTVDQTNRKNLKKTPYYGQYFTTSADASPFEAWLADLLDHLAAEEMKMGWQHPLSFVNWVTTDPLAHPDEPYEQEDMASVDPVNIVPTDQWMAGYFAAYHVYPYYPDSLRFQKDYQSYVNSNGKNDPYEAYLVKLKEHHPGIPLVIAEFGVPSSRGMAHRGPLGRNQGMHTEEDQGQMNIEMLQAIKNAGGTGAFIFEFHDEWFKFTWNTWDLEIPAARRASWLNRLTNEENFGLIAVEPGNWTKVLLDGNLEDWSKIEQKDKSSTGDNFRCMVSSDEAYLYLALKKEGNWNWQDESICIGFDTQPGGNRYLHDLPVKFNQGMEFVLSINNKNDAYLKVAGSYDQHSYLYGYLLKKIPWEDQWQNEDNGIFLPWKLCLSNELFLPAAKKKIGFEEIEIGKLVYGNSSPDSAQYNSLADYYFEADVLEMRIPWMMLGFTDPGSHQVWSYPYREKLDHFTSIASPRINIEGVIIDKGNNIEKVLPLLEYDWQNWDMPSSHERKKQSYYLIQSYIKEQNN